MAFFGRFNWDKSCAKRVMENHSRDTDKVVDWNKTLLQSKLLKRINDDFSITYQVSH